MRKISKNFIIIFIVFELIFSLILPSISLAVIRENMNYDKALEIIKQQIEDMKKGDFTEEEVENAKQGIVAAIKSIDDEQDTEIMYFFGQELSKNKLDIDKYMDRISKGNKQNVVDIANKVSVNTVYFLKN